MVTKLSHNLKTTRTFYHLQQYFAAHKTVLLLTTDSLMLEGKGQREKSGFTALKM